MPSLTLPAKTMHFVSAGLGFEPRRFAKRDNGNLVFEGVPVFRSGTFRDSTGEQNTWEGIHIRQMLDNFNYLRNEKVFEDVPVRDNHPNWLMGVMPGQGRVVGWHTGLEVAKMRAPHDGEEYDYLLASYEITDARAAEAVENGTWRNRSSEILRYLSNAEAEYWPVYGGFAFVDIPAVEGLNFSSPTGETSRNFFVYFDREHIVGQPLLQGSTGPATGQVNTLPFSNRIAQPAQPAQSVLPAEQTLQPVQSIQPVQPATPNIQSTQHSFTINGAATTDYAAVQAHISALEGAIREQRDAARTAFVNGLAGRNVIAATDVESMFAFARTLTDEQYAMWTKQYASATPNPLFANHAAVATTATANGTPQSASGSAVDDDIEVAKGIVAAHKASGMSRSTLEQTPSFKKLAAAGITV